MADTKVYRDNRHQHGRRNVVRIKMRMTIKKLLAGILCLMMVTMLYTVALAETAIDQTTVATQVVIWVLCGLLTTLSALATWAI